MADYSELGSLIGRIKRAAIDCYMTEEAQYYEIDGDRYLYRGSGRGMPQYCSRPGENGEGGGDASIGGGMPDFLVNHLDAEWRSAFDTIRGQVDDVFDDLRDIPDGGLLFFEETLSMRAAETLTPGGAETSSEGGGSSLDLNNAILSQRVNSVHGYCYRLSSATINAFRSKYADRLGAILDGQAALAATMGMGAAGQVAVFKQLREDAVTLASKTLASLEAKAGEQSSSDDGGASFAIGGAIFSILGLVGGPGGAALAAIGTTGGLISDLWPDPPPQKSVAISGGNYSEILSSANDIKVKMLESTVTDETAIQTALEAASTAVDESALSFDITPPDYPRDSYGEDVGGPGTIQQNHDDMQRLAATCQLISEIVDDARSSVSSADQGSGEWNRPAGIGIGTVGPYYAFSNLGADVVKLTRNTAEELAEAATKLIKASLDFQATDSQVAQTLSRETAELRSEEGDG